MKRKLMIVAAAVMAICQGASAALTSTSASGWLESCWMEFSGMQNSYSSYHGYVSADGGNTWTPLDGELIRSYGSYGRVDALGLTPGNYQLKVVPVTNDAEVTGDQVVSGTLSVAAHDRNGFAHINRSNSSVGIGAYNDNGTLKSGARVLYVTAATASTVSMSFKTSSSGATMTATGLQNIINAHTKYFSVDKRPLAIRIIGCIKASDMDAFSSSAEGVQVKPSSAYTRVDFTLEGVGKDAAVHGFGFLCRNLSYAEFRNFAILNCMDDAMSLDTKNSHIWIHNLDLFYGKTGSDADQAKGDGTIDLKGNTKDITIAYNHFFDNGKSSLCGMKSEITTSCITYHHNWFDHSDSRHPRIRTMSVHVYNNYFDGNAKYGVGVTMGASCFVESNYFRNCKNPMMSSMQGTDADGAGTFSGEAGGIIKSFGNVMTGSYHYKTYQANGQSSDAYQVASRGDQVPSSVTTVSGGTSYNNFDQQILSAITPDEASQVPSIVTGANGAGRCQKGDFSWNFSNSTEDANYAVISALKTAIVNYSSSLVGIIGSGSATAPTQPETPDPGEGGETPDPSAGETDSNLVSGSYECYFTGGTPSSSFYTVTGNYSSSKGSVIVNGTTYSWCLKMESSTRVTFTLTETVNLYLMLGGSGNDLKVDGVTYAAGSTGSILVENLAAGEHVISKAGSYNLFYINAYAAAGEDPEEPEDPEEQESSDATLSALTIGGNSVAGFSPDVYVYNVELPAGTSVAPTVAATANHAAASVNVSQAAALPGDATVVVTAENEHQLTYTIHFSVAASEPAEPEDNFWNFSDSQFAGLGSDSLNCTVDGITFTSHGKSVTYTASSKTIDEISFSKAIKLAGAGSKTQCCLSFEVANNCTIEVYANSGGSRTIQLETAGGTKIGTASAPTAGAKTCIEYKGEPTTIYLYSTGSSVNIYGIRVTAATYSRNVTEGNYGTICLPFGVRAGHMSGATFYEVVGANENYVNIAEVSALTAGKPYIYLATGSQLEVTYTGNEATEPVAANGLVGNLSETPIDLTAADNASIISGNQVHLISGTAVAHVKQYRAYLLLGSIQEISAAGRHIEQIVLEDQTATGLETMPQNEAVKYIENGQLIIIKNGIHYNALGLRIK